MEQAELISITQAARFLMVNRRTIYQMISDGRLQGTRLGPRGPWRVLRRSIDDLIADNQPMLNPKFVSVPPEEELP